MAASSDLQRWRTSERSAIVLRSPDLPHAVSIESCVFNALWAWDRREKFIDADAGAKTIRLRSTPKAERRFFVKIDVRIPSYDV